MTFTNIARAYQDLSESSRRLLVSLQGRLSHCSFISIEVFDSHAQITCSTEQALSIERPRISGPAYATG